MNKYFELKVVVMVTKDIHRSKCSHNIGIIINAAMDCNQKLREKHAENTFKMFSFDQLSPRAINNIYGKGALHTFRLRSFDFDFIETLSNLLVKVSSPSLKVVMTNITVVHKKTISELVSITPVVKQLEKDKDGKVNINEVLDLEDSIIYGLVRKYNMLSGKSMSPTEAANMFISSEVSNPITINYKNTNILGAKYKFHVAQDELSQDLAFIAECTGLGQKSSSMGTGFCYSRYVRG